MRVTDVQPCIEKLEGALEFLRDQKQAIVGLVTTTETSEVVPFDQERYDEIVQSEAEMKQELTKVRSAAMMLLGAIESSAKSRPAPPPPPDVEDTFGPSFGEMNFTASNKSLSAASIAEEPAEEAAQHHEMSGGGRSTTGNRFSGIEETGNTGLSMHAARPSEMPSRKSSTAMQPLCQGLLMKLPLSARNGNDLSAIPDKKWKQRYVKLFKDSLVYFDPAHRNIAQMVLGTSLRLGRSIDASEDHNLKQKGEVKLTPHFEVHEPAVWPTAFIIQDGDNWICLKAGDREQAQQWRDALDTARTIQTEELEESTRVHQTVMNRIVAQQLVWKYDDIKDKEALHAHLAEPKEAARANRIAVKGRCSGHVDNIHSIAWSSDGELILTAAKEPRLILWDATRRTNNQLATIPLYNGGWTLSCAISPSSSLIAAGGLQEKVLIGSWKKQQVAGKKYPLNAVGEHEGYVSSLCFLGDDRNLVSGSGDSFVRVWDVGAKGCKAKFTHEADVLSVAANPRDPSLVLAGGADMECRVHDVRMMRCAAIFQGAESDVEHVAFNPAVSHFFVGSSLDGVCRIYDMRRTGSDPVVQTPVQPFPINQAAFSRDGRWLYAALQKSSWYVFDAYTGNFCNEVEGHSDVISCLAVSEQTGVVCTGSWDNTVTMWDVNHPNYWRHPHRNSLAPEDRGSAEASMDEGRGTFMRPSTLFGGTKELTNALVRRGIRNHRLTTTGKSKAL